MKFFAFSFLATLAATVAGFVCTNDYYPYAACCESFSDEIPNYCNGRIDAQNLVINRFSKEQLYICRNATRSVGACCDEDNDQEVGCLPFDVADGDSS